MGDPYYEPTIMVHDNDHPPASIEEVADEKQGIYLAWPNNHSQTHAWRYSSHVAMAFVVAWLIVQPHMVFCVPTCTFSFNHM